MKRLVISAAAIAAAAIFTPLCPSVQGIGIDVPGVGVRGWASRAIATTAATTVRSSASVASIVSGTSACVAAAGR